MSMADDYISPEDFQRYLEMRKAEQAAVVPTEAEKDSAKRKRDAPQSPPPPTQQDELDQPCQECGNYLIEEDQGECPYCAAAGLMEIHQPEAQEEEPEEDEGEEAAASETGLPDLHEYFEQYPAISDENVISMCRAYASYLASLSKKKIFKEPVITKKRRTRQTR